MRANTVISRRGFLRTAGTFVLLGGLGACARSHVEDRVARPTSESNALTVFATTAFLGDIVRNVVPEADLTVMVGSGGNAHTYEPNTRDLAGIQSSKVVLWMSPQLESLMDEQLEAQDPRQFAVMQAVTDADALLLPTEKTWLGDTRSQALAADPHVWMSPPMWKPVVEAVAERIIAAADPEKADSYRNNADIYLRRIDELDTYIQDQVAAIDEDSRVLITGYDGFQYFGKTYGFEVHSVQPSVIERTDDTAATAVAVTSTTPAPDAAPMSERAKALSDLVMDRHVKTLFADNIAGKEDVDAVRQAVRARGGQVAVADRELLVGSLGRTAPLDGYIGALRYNADVLRAGLEAKKSHA